ncbi:MAG: transposase [Candidatus Cloacimonadaceae bacterium]
MSWKEEERLLVELLKQAELRTARQKTCSGLFSRRGTLWQNQCALQMPEPYGNQTTGSQANSQTVIYAYSSVIQAKCEMFSLLAYHCDCQIMSFFAKELSEEYQAYRNIIIMDKAARHNPNELHTFDYIRYIFLPPYSPELNPAEHLWKDAGNKKFRNTIALRMTLKMLFVITLIL